MQEIKREEVAWEVHVRDRVAGIHPLPKENEEARALEESAEGVFVLGDKEVQRAELRLRVAVDVVRAILGLQGA